MVEAVVAKSVVVVALEVVLLTPVKFWKVEEPLESRLPKVPRVETVSEPVKLAALEIVWPLIKPEVVMVLAVKLPMLPLVEKRLVEEAVVLKMLVVVAEVVVERVAIKLVRVVWPSSVIAKTVVEALFTTWKEVEVEVVPSPQIEKRAFE